MFHFQSAPSAGNALLLAGAVRQFFESIKARIPGDININFPGEMTVHADDGTLTGAVVVSPAPALVDCAGLGAYAAPTGARVMWETGTVVAGRRIRGRTFLVPLTAGDYDPVGTILSTTITTITNAANALVATADALVHPLVVWSPTTSTTSPVAQGIVPDQATVLRSRRG